jgi:hypothetical protein
MHKRIRGDRIQDASKSRRSAYVSRIARMHAMVSLCKKPGLSCPKTGVIVPQIFSDLARSLIFTVVSMDLMPLCTPNKIYKIDNVPARLMATGRLLECLTFRIFLDTTTAAERRYAELPPY